MATSTTKTVSKTVSIAAGQTVNIKFGSITIPAYREFMGYAITVTDSSDLKLYKYGTSSFMGFDTFYDASTAEEYIKWTDSYRYPTITVKNSSSTESHTVTFSVIFKIQTVDVKLILYQMNYENKGLITVYANNSTIGTLSHTDQFVTVSWGDRIELSPRGSQSPYVFSSMSFAPSSGISDYRGFTMPDNDIRIYFYVTEGYHLNISVHGGEGNTITYSAEHTGPSNYIKSGDVVTLIPHPAEGYVYKDFTTLQAQKLNKTQFTMPSTETFIVATFDVKPDNVVGYYNGTEFVPCTVNYYDGTDFVECEPYYYDGTDWVPISTS